MRNPDHQHVVRGHEAGLGVLAAQRQVLEVALHRERQEPRVQVVGEHGLPAEGLQALYRADEVVRESGIVGLGVVDEWTLWVTERHGGGQRG